MNWTREALRLYAVTDRRWLNGQTLEAQVEAALRGGATCVQLREKETGLEEMVATARRLVEICRRYGAPLIVNDSVEAALRSGADGVHLGQGDGSAREARRRLGPDAIVGVTTKTVEQALRAQDEGADYLGSGAVFGSATKLDARPMRRETLCEICAAVQIPVVAIGGIQRGNIDLLAGTGVAGAAVVSGIFAAADVEAECRYLRARAEALGRTN